MKRSQNYLIISEQRLFTDTLELQLSRFSDTNNISKANNSGAACEFAQQMNSGIAILDCDIPPDGPFEVASRIQTLNDRIAIIMLIDSMSNIMIHQALKVGIENIFLKTNTFQSFESALNSIANGEKYISRKIRDHLIFDEKRNHHSLRIDSSIQALNDREIEVLRYLSRGYTVKEVSRKMYLSPKSIDSHKHRIMAKLNIHDRVKLSRDCIREGLIQP